MLAHTLSYFSRFLCLIHPKAFEPRDDIDRRIYSVSREHKISILPVLPNLDIDSYYPLTDHPELWNVFVVASDRSYVTTNINDAHLKSPTITNTNSILPTELQTLFDSIWTKTLSGRSLQFYMVWNGKLFFASTCPFYNGKRKITGAIMFLRSFESMPETRFTSLDGYIIPLRQSKEIFRGSSRKSFQVRQSMDSPSGLKQHMSPPPPITIPEPEIQVQRPSVQDFIPNARALSQPAFVVIDNTEPILKSQDKMR